MSYTVIYTSCNINNKSAASHWGQNNLICFGTSNYVGIYDPFYGSGGKVIHTLLAHNSYVNSTRWISGKNYETEIISGSADGRIILWTKKEHEFVPYVIAECNEDVIVADGYYRNVEACVYVVVAKHNIFIYERQFTGGAISATQTINLNSHILMTMKFSHLPLINTLVFGVVTHRGTFMLFVEDSDGTFSERAQMQLHSDWTLTLDFVSQDSDLLFATGSEDSQIKVWKITPHDPVAVDDKHLYVHNELIRKKVKFRVGEQEFRITLDAILEGHTSWIYSVSFNQPKLQLLSVSEDQSLIIWHKHEESNMWVEKERFGNISIGDSGFKSGMFGPNGDIFAKGINGSFHLWLYCPELSTWRAAVTVGGHYAEVEDLAWEPHGQFIFTASRDSTTRIHAPWTKCEKETTWHEIARPQTHGYEINCLALLTRYQFVSGAEEKVIRMFRAPQPFVNSLHEICRFIEDANMNEELGKNYEDLPQGAFCPTLELSNKAVIDLATDVVGDDDSEGFFKHFISHFPVLKVPPSEEDLRGTLWPESQKLYGHGNEIFALAATPDGKILASACKATTRKLATIILWDVSSQIQIDELESHNLTVTQLTFSPNSQYLLSVSRDRRWSLFTRDSCSNNYKLYACSDGQTGIHTRIIWCCAWLPNSVNFATGSRDGKVIIWKEQNQDKTIGRYVSAGAYLDLKNESITALAITSFYIHNLPLIAIGLDSGIIHLYYWRSEDETNPWKLHLTISQSDAHHKTVKKLAFRNKLGRAGQEGDDNILQLASCGADAIVRIYEIRLDMYCA